MNEHINPHDVLNYRFLSSPRFSPDGAKIAFLVHQADLKENRYFSNLWIYNLASERATQLTSSGSEKAFCWSVDGTKILLVSERGLKDPKEKENKKKAALYSIVVEGGEALLLAQIPEPVTELWALGEDQLLLKTVADPDEPRFEDADYMIFTQIPFCSNGKGFTGQKRAALSSYAISTADLRHLSPEDMAVGQTRISTDRKRALAVGMVYKDVMPETSGVWEFNLENGAVTALLPQESFAWFCAAPFGGGVLATGTNMKHYGKNENARFYLKEETKEKLDCLTPELDRGLRSSVICDCRYGLTDMNLAFWVDSSASSPSAWFVSTDDYHARLHRLWADGSIEQVTQELRSVDDFDVRGDCAAVVGLEGLFLQELYLVENGRERRLTDFNRAMIASRELSVPEYVHLENGTPWGLDCWYMRPVGFEVGKKYPTLLHIHGGPKMTFGDVFVHEMQCWAAEGFVVLFCNPRGSDGKGNEFDDIRGKYGTIDYDDLMLFTDWAVETLPFVDKNRMGVTGGSYGGFMTNWIVGHTDRFRAAVTQRSICNWVSMTGLSDIGHYFVADQQAADVWSDVDKLWWHSPLKYADQIKTPTLVIHSDEDHRCEVSQGLQMFSALKRNGVESKICVFKGENHELSRGGRPKSRLARLQEIIKWFKEHL
ncbi:MAG: S9 family peptidase [Synergistaceae bacterium]|jgi:dipeptidyl aminopeptidase/acylaminoacyl peptidase|nr:S9 family peptidase [Synergistaceae bacterium]